MLVTWQTNILNYYSDMFAEYNTVQLPTQLVLITNTELKIFES